MAGFLYAIRGLPVTLEVPRDQTDPVFVETLRNVGLTYLLGTKYSCVKVQFGSPKPNSPAPESTWLFNPQGFGEGSKAADPTLDFQNQRWESFDRFHLGFWITGGYARERPTPEDLRRKQTFASAAPMLGDDQRWLIPIVPITAKGEIVGDSLPQKLCVKDGKPSLTPAQSFGELIPLVEKYWNYKKLLVPIEREVEDTTILLQQCQDLLRTEQAKDKPNADELKRMGNSILSYDKQLTLLNEESEALTCPGELERMLDCCAVLERNYHVSWREVGMLDLLDSRIAWNIISRAFLAKAEVDLEEAAKKRGSRPSAESSPSFGEITQAPSLTTVPAPMI